MIPIIGIVGGIGSGKSAVALALQRLGGFLIIADHLGHEALRDAKIREKLIARWGTSILDENGDVDRRKLGRIVFADPAELRALESLVFPFIEKRILEEIARARATAGVKFIVLDAAILLEAGWGRHCDRIVFVEAPRDLRLTRVKETRGWSEQELERRERAQMPLEEKRVRASTIIVNDGDLEKVARQAQSTLEQFRLMC